MSLFFDFLYFLPALVYAPVFFLKSRRVGENPVTLFSERWGIYASEKLAKISGKKILWIHAVSVGEVVVARSFISSLRQVQLRDSAEHQNISASESATQPAPYHFVLTTVTPTGQKLARQAEAEDLTAFYVPFDFSWCVNAFLQAVKPAALALVETEIWPNLILQSAAKNIPICLINARLSEKSLQGYSRIRVLFQNIFSKIQLVLAQEESDARRFRDLGIAENRVLVMGNIKFDTAVPSLVPEAFQRARVGIAENDFVWVAGSTHPGEEESLLRVFSRLRRNHPKMRMILAPRHVERTEEVAVICAKSQLKTVLFTDVQIKASDVWDVMVVDQIGVLKNVYAFANFVFMGGSWIKHGGQNPIEPAVFDLPILHGPHIFNFKQIYTIFDEAGGAYCVADEESCFQRVEAFLNQPELAFKTGQRAGETVKKYRGAGLKQAQRIMELIQDQKGSAQ